MYTPVDAMATSQVHARAETSRLCRQCLNLCGIGFLALVLLVSLLYASVSAPFFQADLMSKPSASQDLHTGALSNGLRYSILNVPLRQDRFSAYLRVDAGSLDESDEQLGIAHFVEHMAFDNTRDFPGRGGLWEHMLSLGASFNAFTSWRLTNYEFWDVPMDHMADAFEVLRNQALHQDTVQSFADLEKGAVLGEARYRNGTGEIEFHDLFLNHFGPEYRPALRMPIGKPDQMDYSVANVGAFLRDWYRIDRMHLIVVGDLGTDPGAIGAVENTIAEQWGAEPAPAEPAQPHEDFGPVRPIDSIFIRQVVGEPGVSFSLLATSDYPAYPRTRNYHRQQLTNIIFSVLFDIAVTSRLANTYPEEIPVNFAGRGAAVYVDDEYALGTRLHGFDVSVPGHPERGTWQRDLEIAATELRRLAVHGPDPDLLLEIMLGFADQLTASEQYMGGPSTAMADAVLGDHDADFVYLDPHQKTELYLSFLTQTYLEVTADHIQTEAAFLWSSLVSVTTGEWPDESLIELPATFNVFYGRSATSEALGTLSHEQVRQALVKIVSVDSEPLAPVPDLTFGAGLADPPLPVTGLFLDLDRVPLPRAAEPVDSDPSTGISRYRLANGMMVNLKPSQSGQDSLPSGPPGRTVLELSVLGGKALESPELHGACEFVNMGHLAGVRVAYSGSSGDSTDFDSSTYNLYRMATGASASLICEDEHLVVQTTLHGDCPNYPDLVSCATPDDPYLLQLEAVRLMLMPRYDTRSIDVARLHMRRSALEAGMVEDPLETLRRDGRRSVLQHAFPGDRRLEPVTADDIAALDPLRVQEWVRQQFDPQTIEISVAGDFNADNLLFQLAWLLGTFVATPANIRVGLHPYSFDDVAHFERPQPAGGFTLNCSLESVAPDRAYAVLMTPAGDAREQRDSGADRAVASLLSMHMFYNVRRDHGFGYFAMTSSRHSILFPGHGWREVTWAPGNYPTPTDESDPLNLAASTAVVKDALGAPFDRDMFDAVMAQLQSQTRAALQEPQSWLSVMRGLSHPVPASWNAPGTTVKPLARANVLEDLAQVRYEDVGQFVVTEGTGVFLEATVVTVPVSDAPDAECFLGK